MRHTAQRLIVIRPLAAVRVIVRRVVIRLHAARSAIEDSANFRNPGWSRLDRERVP
jgi:hypothetical protein